MLLYKNEKHFTDYVGGKRLYTRFLQLSFFCDGMSGSIINSLLNQILRDVEITGTQHWHDVHMCVCKLLTIERERDLKKMYSFEMKKLSYW